MIPAWIFLEVFSTPVALGLNQFHVSFRKWSRSQHTFCDFKFSTATLTKHDNQTALIWDGFPSPWNNRKTCFYSQLALSVTCTNTPRLSADDCLQDAGMLQPGISYSRAAAHFGFHRDIVQKLQKYYHVSFTACDWLRSHHQRVMSKGRGVYIRGKHVHNRSQTACVISWQVPGLCAISTKTGQNHMRGARHLPLSTLCVGLHAMLQENHHESQLFSVSAIPDEEVTSLNQFYSLLKVVFTWAEVLNMCGMRWSVDFVICISSLLKPTDWQQLIKDLV